MQVSILSGIYGAKAPEFERSVPVNLTPVAEPGDGSGSGVSKGYLKLAAGVRPVFDVSAADRGGFVFQGEHLRVVGSVLSRVGDAGLVPIGDVGDDTRPVTWAEGFGRVAIASAGKLYYYDNTTLTQVTDPDLGLVLSVAWQDGYFVTTDGTSLVATDLADPTSVDPLRYGSSEADPDPLVGVLSLRGELYALNRYTIEKFVNGGGTGFPFLRSRGSQIPKGVVGPHAFAPFVETFAFVGSARNETTAVYLAGSGQAIRISPRVLDQALAGLSDYQLSLVEVEALNSAGLYQLLVHLPTDTWVYHWTASQLLDLPVWSRLASGPLGDQAYEPRHFTSDDGRWWCGGNRGVGVVDPSIATVFGEPIGWRFDTPLVYNGGRGALVHELELVTQGGRGAANQAALSYTDDGVTWSNERHAAAGGLGARSVRPVWRRLGRLTNWRGFRFRGVAASPLSFARLEAQMEPLGG